MKYEFIVEGMKCAHCSKRIETALKELESIKEVNINLETKLVVVETDSTKEEIINTIKKAGYEVK